MNLVLIVALTLVLSIAVGYFGIAVEYGVKKLKDNHSEK